MDKQTISLFLEVLGIGLLVTLLLKPAPLPVNPDVQPLLIFEVQGGSVTVHKFHNETRLEWIKRSREITEAANE